jgi:hypothetical protein
MAHRVGGFRLRLPVDGGAVHVHGGDRGTVKLPHDRVRRTLRQEERISARDVEVGQPLFVR